MAVDKPNYSELRVAANRQFQPGLKSKLEIMLGAVESLNDPGDKLNLMSGHKFREIRGQIEPPTPYVGVQAPRGQRATAVDVPNPDAPDGRWDPYTFMPRFTFDPAEDSLPVAPDFDGNANLDDNGPKTANGPEGDYKHGVIGGRQPLSGGFVVTKKGDYTVLTYSFYYADNKAGEYHANDYSTAQVYLKPGKDGKLAPAYLMTSWHHGAMLTPWKDLKKDADGRPIVGVELGSHALVVKDKVPTKGLQLSGDGKAWLNGKPVGQRISYDAFQTNVKGARYLNPARPEAAPRLEAMRWGDQALNPFLPEIFQAAPPAWEQFVSRGLSAVKQGVAGLWHKAEGLLSGL